MAELVDLSKASREETWTGDGTSRVSLRARVMIFGSALVVGEIASWLSTDLAPIESDRGLWSA